MTEFQPRIDPLGDTAVTITLGQAINETTRLRVQHVARLLGALPFPAVQEIVPAYASVTVFYDPLHLDYTTLAESIRPLLLHRGEPTPGEEAPLPLAVPVTYDGPDLKSVAEATGLHPDDVVRRHAAPLYRVFVVGFVPGFAYLGTLDPGLALPRRASPRVRVPAGSVAIAETQTAVYPLDTPGGWHLIGSTTTRFFNPERTPAALLRVGDTVRFEPR